MMKTKVLKTALHRIGLGLSILRIQKGYNNVSAFAHDYKLPLIQYWRIEKGKANLTLRSLMRILAIHKLAPEEFFCWLKQVI